jgi:methylmalonyl-CoA/ethylmalonyl-CoA epimerase
MFSIRDPKSATTERSTSLQRLHHVGFVVKSIDRQIGGFVNALAATWDGKIIHDPLQCAKVTFLRTPGTGDALIELVEPAVEDSPVSRFTKQGGGLHHICYEVRDLAEHLKSVKAARCQVVRKPRPAVAFEQRLIAWALTPERLLLEFLEAPKNTADLPFVELVGDKSS